MAPSASPILCTSPPFLSGANVLSFQHYSGQDCTILVSKQGGKYRLQSDHLEAMWLSLHVSVEGGWSTD